MSDPKPLLPTTNADGRPVVPMTDEQKYSFDLKGWLLLPALIPEDDLKDVREHVHRVFTDRESLPAHERHQFGGPGQVLLDHPALVGVLNEIISHQGLATEDIYGFRFDGGHIGVRHAGDENYGPHGGGGLHNFAHNSHFYQHQRGKVFSGLTRVVWELNPVEEGDGGTLLLTGSHKAAFPRPKAIDERRDPNYFETYSCPAGSCLVFTESLTHSGNRWTNENRPRIATFTCYNTIVTKWHKGHPPREVIQSLPAKRQSLFRGAWHGMNDVPSVNRYVDEANLELAGGW